MTVSSITLHVLCKRTKSFCVSDLKKENPLSSNTLLGDLSPAICLHCSASLMSDNGEVCCPDTVL